MYNLNDLEKYNRIITFNDDVHSTEIFLNGEILTALEDENRALVTLSNALEPNKTTIGTDIYCGDTEWDFVPEEWYEDLWDYLCNTNAFTIEEELALFNKNYYEFARLVLKK